MRVLIVEDNQPTMMKIADALEAVGHRSSQATNGELALECIAANEYDIIILDRMLPRFDGLNVLRQIRAWGNRTPVLMLTALGQISDRVDGLEAGADDYLVKPFAIAELVARLNALFRRRTEDQATTSLASGRLTMDLLHRDVRYCGKAIQLQPREFRLLEELVRNSDRFVTRSMLLQRVWDLHFDPQTNIVETHMSRLRAKLALGGAKEIIEFRRGDGYRLRAQDES